MNRKICVLVYSQFSPASKRLMEYIERLPFDLVQLTGMTLLPADCDEIRTVLSGYEIATVPVLIVQYFDGKMMILKDDEINKFISAVSKSLSLVPSQRPPDVSAQREMQRDPASAAGESSTQVPAKPLSVTDLALEMQKSREEPESKKRTVL